MEHTVERAEALPRGDDDPLHGGAVGHVGAHREDLGPLGLEVADRRHMGGGIAPHQHEPRVHVARQPPGEGEAQAAEPAGDEIDAAPAQPMGKPRRPLDARGHHPLNQPRASAMGHEVDAVLRVAFRQDEGGLRHRIRVAAGAILAAEIDELRRQARHLTGQDAAQAEQGGALRVAGRMVRGDWLSRVTTLRRLGTATSQYCIAWQRARRLSKPSAWSAQGRSGDGSGALVDQRWRM